MVRICPTCKRKYHTISVNRALECNRCLTDKVIKLQATILSTIDDLTIMQTIRFHQVFCTLVRHLSKRIDAYKTRLDKEKE